MPAGLRFIHPDLDAGRPGFSTASSGALDLARDETAIRQGLVLLLSTVPGERVRRPEFGCDLHQLLFATNDETTQGLAIHYVTEAVAKWEPRVELVTVDASAHPDIASALVISLSYRVRASGITDQIALALDLADGGGPQ